MDVRYVLFISAMKAELEKENPLKTIEMHLLESGVDSTILRPNLFMENFTKGWMAPMIMSGTILLPAGNGKTSFISVKDIARVAAVCLKKKRSGQQYNLTGSRALSYAEAARLISDGCGRTVTYNPVSEKEMMRTARKQGFPESAIRYMAQLFAFVRRDLMAETTDSVREATGKSPISFEEFVRENAHLWKERKAA